MKFLYAFILKISKYIVREKLWLILSIPFKRLSIILLFWSFVIYSNIFISFAYDKKEKIKYISSTNSSSLIPVDGTLGEVFQNGTLSLVHIPYLLIYLMDFFTKIAGTLAVLAIVWGGIQYVFSGVTEEKESAKNTLKYAIIGLFVTFWAWIAVNMVQVALTG
jgi:hypothetical protein